MVEHPFSYPVVRDGDGEVGARYRLEALPHIVVVGRDGRIRGSYVGYTSKATLEKAVREAVEAAPDRRPLVAPRRRRGVRLLFFQVAALSRFARERLALRARTRGARSLP